MEQKTYKTTKEWILDKFFTDVVGVKMRKIKKTDTLRSLVTKKKFEEEFVDMYVDKVQIIFNVNIRKLKNKPLEEIILHIENQKRMHSFYGQRK